MADHGAEHCRACVLDSVAADVQGCQDLLVTGWARCWYGPRPLSSTRRHGLFLNLTCNIRLSDMPHGGKKDSDMRHELFLKFDM